MKIKPFEGIDNINFDDNYNEVKNKLRSKYEEDMNHFMDKKYPRLYIKELDLIICFYEDYKSIRYFEFHKESKEIIFQGVNLINKEYSELLKFIKEIDSNIEIDESDFTSKKLGITVGREVVDSKYSEEITSIVIFDDKYCSEPEIDLEELYKSIMGKDYPS